MIINSTKEDIIVHTLAITYGIWYARNQQVFENKDIPEESTIRNAIKSVSNYMQANIINSDPNLSLKRNKNCGPRQQANQWQKPLNGMIKINSDANLMEEGFWGLGAVCRYADGEVLAAATWKTKGFMHPATAEAMALYTTMEFA